jgi:hypothetical protein
MFHIGNRVREIIADIQQNGFKKISMSIYGECMELWHEDYAIFLADSQYGFYGGISYDEFWEDFMEYLVKEFPDTRIKSWSDEYHEFEISRNKGRLNVS